VPGSGTVAAGATQWAGVGCWARRTGTALAFESVSAAAAFFLLARAS